MGFFSTRGEDYLFVWCGDYKIRVYKYDKGTLTAYNNWDSESSNIIEIAGSDLLMYEEVWFAEHFNEFYFGNMSEGMYRFSPGHQSVVRGSVPLDIVVEPAEEGAFTKSYTEWWFAYDYEYKGGRSPLSRNARARLFSSDHSVKVTMDYPPIISKNRRIYASPTDPASSATWYFVKEITDRNTLEVTLDEELSSRISDEYKYSEKISRGISPKAKFAAKHDNMLWVSYLVESPSISMYFDPYHPYAEEKNFFDVGEEITNVLSFREYHFVTTPNKIWALRAKPDEKILAESSHGAHEGSLAVVNGILFCLTDKGIRISKDGFNWEPLPGIDSVDFSDLQKTTRFDLWSAQQDYEEGSYNDGINSDFVPGGLTLQPNLYSLESNKVLETQWSGTSTDYFGTSERAFFVQKFQVRGDTGDSFTATHIQFYMQAYNTDGLDGFAGWIAEEEGGVVNLGSDGQLAEFSGKVGDWAEHKFELSQAVELDVNTNYYIVIPKCGYAGQDWQLSFREFGGVGDDENPLYPEGEWLQYTDSDETNLANYTKQTHNTILKFALYGRGDVILQSPKEWADFTGAYTEQDSDTYSYYQNFTPQQAVSLKRIEIAVENKNVLDGKYPTITIETVDSNNEPSGSVVATATGFTYDGQVMRAEFDGTELTAGTTYCIHLSDTGGQSAGYSYCMNNSVDITGGYSDDDGSSWTSWPGGNGLWCKLFVGSAVDIPSFASGGDWTSQQTNIGEGNSYKKLYASLMQPDDAGIKIELRGYDQSEGDWTDYQTLYDTTGANNTDNLPYDIAASLAEDIIKIQVKVTLELSTAKYTPIVDSILATYELSGDAGDKLHVGNVKGDFWLSKESLNGIIFLANDTDGLRAYRFDGNDFTCIGHTDTEASEVWDDGKYIYAINPSVGITVFTFDGSDFTEVATLEIEDTDYIYDIWNDGTYFYIACGTGGLKAYKFDGNDFTLLDSIDDGDKAIAVCGDGTYIYLANWQDGLRAYTFDGTTLTNVGHIDNGGEYEGVFTDGTYIYAACDTNGLRAYSFNGTTFTLLDTIDNGGNAYSVWWDGTYIYLANGSDGLRAYTFDGSDFSNVGHIDDGGTAEDVWGGYGFIFLANGSDGLRAYTFDGSNFSNAGDIDDGGDAKGVRCSPYGETYVFNKYGNWAELDKVVLNYAPIGDDICLGIMRNPNEPFQNIYKLEDKDSDSWFAGEGVGLSIRTEIETPYLLYNYAVKHFRKNWVGISGDSGEELLAAITVGGGAKLSSDSISSTHSKTLYTYGDVAKPNYISLPRKMVGLWAKINISGDGVDWALNDYIFHYWNKSIRNISVPDSG
jgi:hypothetical protein